MSEHKARSLFGQYAIQPLDTGSPAAGRLLVESVSTQARSLEGRPLAMDSSLMLSDRSTLGLGNPRPRFAAAFGEQRRPMSASSADAPGNRELEKWKNDRL
jgi:hypothetical protein